MTAVNDSAWYLDALDVRAGLAFASYRAAVVDDKTPDVDVPAAFLGPPDFVPVQLANRGLGLSATHRAFQAGLYAGDREVAFKTLDDVAEFVRRGYLRGGGADGPDRGGEGPPPIPEGPLGGDSPESGSSADEGKGSTTTDGPTPPPLEPVTPLGVFNDSAQTFAKTSLSLSVGATSVFNWGLVSSDSTGRQGLVDGYHAASERAGGMLLNELKRRKPGASNATAWQRSVGNLASLLWLGGGWRHHQLLFAIREIEPSTPPFPPFGSWATGGDPLDILESLPLPSEIKSSAWGEATSLLDLLSAFLAAPVPVDGKALDLVLLSAGGICGRPDHVSDDPGKPVRVLEWLTQQLPSRVFAKEVEDSIRRIERR